MSDEQDAFEKTEEPTARRKDQARKDGNVGHSRDLSQMTGMIGAYITLQLVAPYMWEDMQLLTTQAFTSTYSTDPITLQAAHTELMDIIWLILPELLILVVVASIFGAGVTALQTNFLWSWKTIKPKLKSINPIAGIRRIFSANNYMNVAKSIGKLAIIGPIGYYAFMDLVPEFFGLMKVPLDQFFPFTLYATDYIFWEVMKYLLIIGIIDLIWQKWRTKEKLKMSKQEVKDERKAMEGDEATKKKIIRNALQRARDRMYENVPTADVVVTNPTHLAVALTYSMERGEAPKVVAKGRGFVADKIRKIARESGVPVIERKPLARALFKSVEVGMEIPYDLYQAIAELLAYVYKLKGKQVNIGR